MCFVQMSTDYSYIGVACLPKGIWDVLVQWNEFGYGRSVDMTFCVSLRVLCPVSSGYHALRMETRDTLKRYKCQGVILHETLIAFSIEHDVMKNS